MEYPPVLTKTNFVQRFLQGEFGNRGPTWDSIDEFLEQVDPKQHPDKLYHLRNRQTGGPTLYNVSGDGFDIAWNSFVNDHLNGDRSNIYVAEMAPTDKTVLQGEVMRTPKGLSLHGSTLKKPMRDALREQAFTYTGLSAVAYLATYLNRRSYDWLTLLLDRYPDHVVEFSTYSVCWGTVPGFNTVYWEVRNY